MKRFLVLAFIGVGLSSAVAQVTNCSQTLRLANSTYEQGRLHELETLLENCLKSGFTATERVQAYRLLTLAYIYLEEPEKADASMLALLQTDNEFKINEAVDPAEFIALYRTFRTEPVYRLGAKAGTNIAMANVTSSDRSTDAVSKYNFSFGFSAGFSAEIPVKILKIKNLTFNPELYFQITSFNYEAQDSISKTTGPRTSTWVSLPLSLQYQFSKSKFNPYIGLGFETAMLLGSKATDQKIITSNAGLEAKSFDVKNDLNKINYFALATLGAKYKIGKGMMVAELRYHQGLKNMSRIEGTYGNSVQTWDYHTTDAIYKLNYLSLTVGYLINIYNPKKLTFKK